MAGDEWLCRSNLFIKQLYGSATRFRTLHFHEDEHQQMLEEVSKWHFLGFGALFNVMSLTVRLKGKKTMDKLIEFTILFFYYHFFYHVFYDEQITTHPLTLTLDPWPFKYMCSYYTVGIF